MPACALHLSSRPFSFQVCEILEAAGVWNSTLPFADAVQPIFIFMDHLTQARLDAGLLAVRKAINDSLCGHIIKRGCVFL